jgi:probable rRNA maturation factor
VISKAIALLRSPIRELAVIFVNDKEMSDLHGRFMNDTSTTDVMTFPIDVDRRGRAISGEIYVCVPEARRQAKARKTSKEREVILYALHGLLHLCGFDDRTPEDYRRMHRREDQILTRLGIGPVFAPPPASRPKKRRHA